MRTTFALVLAVVLGACGTEDPGGGDDVGTPDGREPDPIALQLQTPSTVEILPGQEVITCWYFRTDNTKPLAIKRWRSTMTPGAQRMVVYTTPYELLQPGTVSTVNCGPTSGQATWTYSAQTPDAELALPTDDGEGKPVAMEIGPNQAGFILVHFLNTTEQNIYPTVTVTAEALDEGTAYTRTASFVTYNTMILVPPGAMNDVEAKTCNVPTTSKFWLMSTHTHKRATRAAVKDGMPSSGTMVFESTNWERPGAARWDGPFYQFSSGKLTYECTYNNPTTLTLRSGDSAQTNEACMASGYFFPATKPVMCFDNVTL